MWQWSNTWLRRMRLFRGSVHYPTLQTVIYCRVTNYMLKLLLLSTKECAVVDHIIVYSLSDISVHVPGSYVIFQH